jgi:hypothetical protein
LPYLRAPKMPRLGGASEADDQLSENLLLTAM